MFEGAELIAQTECDEKCALKTEQDFTLEDNYVKSDYPIAYDVSGIGGDVLLITCESEYTETFSFYSKFSGQFPHLILKNKTNDFVYFDCWGEHFDISSLSSHSITHLCPIASEYSISDFVVGAPVYMSRKVYKHVNND